MVVKSKIFFFISVVLSLNVSAQQITPIEELKEAIPSVQTESSATDTKNKIPPPSEYYTFKQPRIFRSTEGFQPWNVVSVAISETKNLLDWFFHQEAPAWPEEKYQRTHQFGRWINDPTDDTCWNTRAQVLVRDSKRPVTFRGQRNCTVNQGEWLDPYSMNTYTSASEIQIDHLVPLKHAYLVGAWKWDYQNRCLYANYMGEKFHLISVSGHENTSKGDRSPSMYIPPNKAYVCEYIKNWLKVKMIWNLELLPDEAQAIRNLVHQNSCDPSTFQIGEEELQQQKKFISEHINLCKVKNL